MGSAPPCPPSRRLARLARQLAPAPEPSSSPEQFPLPIRATEAQLRAYLAKVLPTAADCEAWIGSGTEEDRAGDSSSRPDRDVGYIGADGILADGAPLGFRGGGAVEGGPQGRQSLTFSSYGEYGERALVNYADRPCRINTYGDSFTACGQTR